MRFGRCRRTDRGNQAAAAAWRGEAKRHRPRRRVSPVRCGPLGHGNNARYGRRLHGAMNVRPAAILARRLRPRGVGLRHGMREAGHCRVLDRNPRALDGWNCPLPILGDPLQAALPADTVILCAIGDPRTKLSLCRELRKRGATFATLIHPSAVVGPGCLVGVGCILGPYSVLTSHVSVAISSPSTSSAAAGHDVVIGDGVTLSSHCDVTGGAVLDEGCSWVRTHRCCRVFGWAPTRWSRLEASHFITWRRIPQCWGSRQKDQVLSPCEQSFKQSNTTYQSAA